jgi:hypothetical protein
MIWTRDFFDSWIRPIDPSWIGAGAAIIFSASGAAETTPSTQVPKQSAALLEKYCIDCHEDGTEKGDVRLDNLAELSLDARLDLMNRMREKVYFEEMPPKKKDQPSLEERSQLESWLAEVLHANKASKLEDKLRMPDYGNKVDHKKLFSGQYKDRPGFTPDRQWLISEFIFDAKMNKLLDFSTHRQIDGKRYNVTGDNNRNGVNLTNPFLLPTHSGVRYYDTTTLDGGHLLTMITNAKEASNYMMSRAKKTNYLPSIEKIMAAEWNDQKILAARETYLNANIEPLLREMFKDKHEAMLPKFVASKPGPPPATVGPDGKPLKKSVFDIATPGNDELSQIWGTMRRNSQNGEKDEELIVKCERDWFLFGVNERTVLLRVNFMRGYMEDLVKRMPKPNINVTKPPADTELAIMREAIAKYRKPGDRYNAIIAACLAAWAEEMKQVRLKVGPITDAMTDDLVDQLFVKIIERTPTPHEKAEYCKLTNSFFQTIGNEKAIDKLIQTLILRSDFVCRQEHGAGEADEHGRKMLSPRDASYAIAHALTDSSPDKQLVDAANSGKLNTREDFQREVLRLLKPTDQYYVIEEALERIGLNDSVTNIPIRKIRFFREFFGYPAMLPIFKDNKRFGGNYIDTAGRLVSEADMLVEHILKEDRDVFEQLLTTEEFFVYHSGDNAAMTKGADRYSKIYNYFKSMPWQSFGTEELKAHTSFLRENPIAGVNPDTIGADKGRQDSLKSFKSAMTSLTERLGHGQTATAPFSTHFGAPSSAISRSGKDMRGSEVAKCFNLDMANWNYPATQPAKMEHRKGMLTHPAWLIAFAANTATDPIRRGKWVREKLLAGTVPDVPVTVDAVIPEDPHSTLRGRLERKTKEEYCWGCHERMNPLGLSFEMYDDFGRYRIEEFLEHPDNLIKKNPDKGDVQDDLRDIYKTLPVDAKGKLLGTDDPNLDGDIKDAIDLTERLAKSTKVRQSIIRHAFRYFMGRNEVLSDSKTLMDADLAYVRNGGSFDAVIYSLLTSDSFIYRKSNAN